MSKLEAMLLKLCALGCGISLVNQIYNCLSLFLAWGDSQWILNALDYLTNVFENSKNPPSAKICSAQLYGKLFNRFWSWTIQPPVKDAYDGLHKMFKHSNDIYSKEAVLETFALIVQSECM